MIDTHIHLDADQYADVADVIKRSRAAGVDGVLAVGSSPDSNRRVLALAEAYRGFVHPALGMHPERPDLSDADFDATLAMIDVRRESICAIGEVGLPYYGDAAKDPDFVAVTRARLARFASEAARLDLALCLHCPQEAASEALRIITRAGVRRAVFHWHKSDEATTRAIVDAGYFISITPEVVYRERDRELARIVPLAKLLVETDGPWPHDGPFAGKLTEPAMIASSIEAIAEIKGENPASVADATASNARRLFHI